MGNALARSVFFYRLGRDHSGRCDHFLELFLRRLRGDLISLCIAPLASVIIFGAQKNVRIVTYRQS
jgi:hypothetical protein